MARIPREDHATIRQRVEVNGEKVAEVAASYGCTPANIYAILAKLRRQDDQEGSTPAPAVLPIEAADASDTADLPAAAVPVETASLQAPAPLPEPAGHAAPPAPSVQAVPAAPPLPSPAIVAPPRPEPGPVAAPVRSRPSIASPAPAPRAGRSGYALMMRTNDGEEAVNPFRSLDELLSAAKPLLRNAARSQEPIWFSIQPVDLDALEEAF
jgi:transposase-like protein